MEGVEIMEHIKAMAIKFIGSLVLLYIVLGLFYGMSFGNVFLITLVWGIASYLGDLFILPRINNTIATIADFGLAFIIIWLMGENLTYGGSVFIPALISAAGLALFEYFFHKYISSNNSREESNSPRPTNLQYQTESSEELTPKRTDFNNENEDTIK